jgi:hypothetical protein
LDWRIVGGQLGLTPFNFWWPEKPYLCPQPQSVLEQTTFRSDTDSETIADWQTSEVTQDSEAQEG